ncbi:MAG TPA: hypothetical protein VHH34_01320 [Pseudonocardiaceae bacterium]|nr:hypothetical protein [Pseudonocardiaceae bacterium]
MINSVDRQLGVLLRQTQWLLDDAAHDIPAGRYHPGKRGELAIVLEHVASLIRATTSSVIEPRGTPTPVIERSYPAPEGLPKQRAMTAFPGRPSVVSEEQ